MHIQHKPCKALATLSVMALMVGLTSREANAQACCSSKACSSNSATSGSEDCHAATPTIQRPDDPPFRAPHGGQLSKTTWNYFEAVYGPHETRLYAYSMFRSPLSTRGMQGQVFLRVRSNGGQFRYPLQYVAVERGQDYLSVHVDLTHVLDGDMDVYFDLTGLPNRAAPSARFVQNFVIFKSVPTREGAYASVPARPDHKEHQRAPAEPPARPFDDSTDADRPTMQGPVARITVTTATPADEAAIRAQGVCPVTNQPLGSHGQPTKIVIDGRPVFVCCRGCIDTVKKEPDRYLAKVGG